MVRPASLLFPLLLSLALSSPALAQSVVSDSDLEHQTFDPGRHGSLLLDHGDGPRIGALQASFAAQDQHDSPVYLAGSLGADSVSRPFVVDTEAPLAPSITLPAPGSVINDAPAAVVGACETGATVAVFEGSTGICSGYCANGAFTCNPIALADGAHVFIARQIDAAFNISPDSAEVAFVLDTEAPAAPAVTTPIEGEVLAAAVVVVSGGCESGATVEVLEVKALLCSAVCTAELFSCETSALGEGTHEVVVAQTDRAGNSGAGTSLTFGVDALAPDAPAIGAPADGARLADATPEVRGSCESGAVVEVLEGATVLCEAACVDSSFSCESSLLADGHHSLTAVQTDVGNNRSAEGVAVNVEVDTTAPAFPTIDVPADGALVARTRPVFGGSSERGCSVTVWIDDEAACTAVVAEDGSWSCAPDEELADGLHAAQASAKDVLGSGSGAGGVVSFTVDTLVPCAPSLLSPCEGQLVGAWPTFGGLSDAGAQVEVRVDGELVCRALADARGAFACLSGVALADGGHQAQAVAIDAAGNASPPSDAGGFVVGSRVAPGAPVFSYPADGSILANAAPEYAGRSEPGAAVSASVDGVVVCIVTASEEGDFECRPNLSLPDGEHRLSAVATNAAGESQSSGEVRFAVDTTAPAAPALSSPADGSVVELSALFAGSAEAGATVEVSVDGAAVCIALADASGVFSCVADEPMAAGEHAVTATATDTAGNASAASAPVGFSAQAGLPPSASIRAPDSGRLLSSARVVFIGEAASGSTVELRIDGGLGCEATASPRGDWSCTAEAVADGEHRASAIATNEEGAGGPCPEVPFTVDTAAPEAPVLVTPTGGETTHAWPRLGGTAEAGSLVRVVVDGRRFCVVRAVADGSFECVGSVPLAATAHEASATALDQAGNGSPASAPIGFSVSVDEPLIVAPADGALTNEATPELSGTAEPGDTVRVVVDGEPVCEATADGSGNWACAPEAPLADGAHLVHAMAFDGFGAVKTTADQSLTVDTDAPEAPVIHAPRDGTRVFGAKTEFRGLAEPGSVVTVEVDGEEVGSALAGGDGAWSCSAELDDGNHFVTAAAEDQAGNGSEASASAAFTTYTELAAPVIGTPVGGEIADGPKLTIAGTGVPLTTVTVTDDLGKALCVVAVDTEGSFACTVQVAAGEWTITAVSTWEAMSSAQSEPVVFQVLADSGLVDGGVGCGCSSGTSSSGGWVWAVALLAVGALRWRRECFAERGG